MREQIHAAKVENCAIVRSHPLKRGRLVCDAWSLRSFLKAVFKSAFVEATLSDVRQRFSSLVACGLVVGHCCRIFLEAVFFQVVLRKDCLPLPQVQPTSYSFN